MGCQGHGVPQESKERQGEMVLLEIPVMQDQGEILAPQGPRATQEDLDSAILGQGDPRVTGVTKEAVDLEGAEATVGRREHLVLRLNQVNRESQDLLVSLVKEVPEEKLEKMVVLVLRVTPALLSVMS